MDTHWNVIQFRKPLVVSKWVPGTVMGAARSPQVFTIYCDNGMNDMVQIAHRGCWSPEEGMDAGLCSRPASHWVTNCTYGAGTEECLGHKTVSATSGKPWQTGTSWPH